MVRKPDLQSRFISFSSFNIIPYFIYTDLMFDLRLVDLGSKLIHVEAYTTVRDLSLVG